MASSYGREFRVLFSLYCMEASRGSVSIRPFSKYLRVYGKKEGVKIILHNYECGEILHVYNVRFRISQWVKGINLFDLKMHLFTGGFL